MRILIPFVRRRDDPAAALDHDTMMSRDGATVAVEAEQNPTGGKPNRLDGDPASTFGLDDMVRLFGARLARDLLACVDAAVLREPLSALGLISPGTIDQDVVLAYFTHPQARLFSPNPMFDELWYRTFYPDIAGALRAGDIGSGFIHFVNSGGREGRWPNPVMYALAEDAPFVGEEQGSVEPAYRHINPQVRLFLDHFPIFTPVQHYNLFGRFMGLDANGTSGRAELDWNVGKRDVIAAEFDQHYYRARYMTGDEAERLRSNAFLHYIVVGVRAGHAPNDWFDEIWYRAFYPDIRKAIDDGRIPSGFYHFLVAGRAEGRRPSFDLQSALEARSPGVTNPVLLDRLNNIECRRRKVTARTVDRSMPTVWFLFPTINPDLTFGGYGAGFELLRAFKASGYHVAIVCTEDRNATKDYFIYRERSATLRQTIKEMPVFNTANGDGLEVAAADFFVAYSTWDLWIATDLVALTGGAIPFLLSQEYEPIFYDYGSIRAVVQEAFTLPHYPIINSHYLLDFLKAKKVGVFAKSDVEEGLDYAVFDHRIGQLPAQTAVAMASRERRVMAVYARPEGHAARNMFELLVLGLRDICERNLLGREWVILGVGALVAHDPIPLGGRHMLRIVPRMSEEEYHSYFGSLDIGVSLMYAPHPSVMPFEFATTGGLVVTNTFENRSADQLRAICANIVPCAPTVAGIVSALEEAIARVGQFEERERNIYRPVKATWEEIFSTRFIEQLVNRHSASVPPAGNLLTGTGCR
ncbi:hypothetical protein LGH83_10595 [Lichenihabitans sp. PAMC28606]|uniref:rhamnosyltransferase WsaF family glycosyltransferase n=1 Tax=Lichenihabitans sp. PAMC28606 TaxID=2880932 RepID=UPI001D0A1006|nr:hypothetical protein [Lichenihabitans sp. PAMC28606]UDL93076.1 hypothetical protein LGH83_10595 [Lichenihabitans sp. PAMC28606]